jgi:hypothetical protein
VLSTRYCVCIALNKRNLSGPRRLIVPRGKVKAKEHSIQTSKAEYLKNTYTRARSVVKFIGNLCKSKKRVPLETCSEKHVIWINMPLVRLPLDPSIKTLLLTTNLANKVFEESQGPTSKAFEILFGAFNVYGLK